jgi:hypothetical protein
MPLLDGFIGGEPGSVVEAGEEVFRSEAAAVEAHVDDYLFKFCESFFEVAKLIGPRKALNMVLDRRNNDRLRCRLAAAKELAEMAKADPAAMRALAPAGGATDVEVDPAVIVRVREAGGVSEGEGTGGDNPPRL